MSVIKAKKRGFIRFQNKSGRGALSREQFEYWMDFLPKVLKIGTEFEINLPDIGQLLHPGQETPCLLSSQPCVKDCANLETCLVERHPQFCLTRTSGSFLGKDFECPAKDDSDTAACRSCPAWQLNCRGRDCSMHTPFCTVCPSFQREGEVAEKSNIRRDAETIRKEMREILQPTGFVGQMGKFGVLEVKKDNSLINNGGIEVPTVGRRVHWNSFYQMSRQVIDPIVERGGFVNERSGQHFHILAGYLKELRGDGQTVSELEVSLPEIILANLHQLHRRYELAMFWITSCGTSMSSLTRWARFRQSIAKYSAMKSHMRKVQKELAENILSMNNNQKGKYASVAYHFCEFDVAGDVSTFHIENRIADGALSPSAITAWAILFYAMVLKAVRLSQYGIMEAGDAEHLRTVRQIQPHLIDGERREWGDNRKADTTQLGPWIPWLRASSQELVTFLKPELHGMGPAYDILMSLAERPCSIRLAAGESWEEVEKGLTELASGRRSQDAEEEIREIVDLAGIVDCVNLESWAEEVAANLGKDPKKVLETVLHMSRSGRYRWSAPIGALITT